MQVPGYMLCVWAKCTKDIMQVSLSELYHVRRQQHNLICVWSSGNERTHIWLVLHVLTNNPSA